MQAAATTTNSSTAAIIKTTTTKKLPTINAASVNSATAVANNNINNNNNNNNNTIKTRVLQKQPQHGALNLTASAAKPAIATEPVNEIEELSKKITEHADALYRTWRIRGLAPTELPEIYKNTTAAAGEDFFVGGAAAAAGSTEGLQQLVNTFVIKDKEQRGVKFSGGGGGSVGAGANDNKTMMKKTTSTEVVKTHIKKPAGQKTTTTTTSKITTTALRAKSPITAASTTISTTTTTTGAKATASTAAPAASTVTTTKITNAKNDACAFINKKFESTSTATSTSPLTPTTLTPKKSILTGVAKTAQSKSPILDVNLNFDLNLLTKQQTANLLKISELLHKEQQKECEKMAAEKRKPKERKIASTAAAYNASNVASITSTTANASLAQEQLENGISAAKTTTITTTAAAKLLKSSTTKATDKTIGNSKLHKNNNNSGSSVDVVDALGGADGISKSTMPSITTTTTTTRAAAAAVAAASAAVAALATDKNSVPSNNKRTTTTQKLTSPVAVKAIVDEENQKLTTSAKLIKATSKVITANAKDTTPETSSVKTTRVTKDKPGLGRVSVKVRESIGGSLAHTTTPATTTTINNNSNSKQSVVGIIGNTAGAHGVAKTTAATTTATTTPTPTTTLNGTLAVSGGANSSMEVARNTAAAATAAAASPTPAATTMPTLNKVKPTSGRAVLTNGQEKNLGRPILTRGSVAERVLMFEKCPDVRNSFLNIKRPDPTDAPPKSLLKQVKLHSTPPPPPDHTSLQREIRTTKSVYIPRFYFPHGKPQPTIAMERVLRGILSAFDTFPNNQVTKDELPQILKLCGLPFYWRMPVMVFCQQSASGLIERQRFVEFWKQMNVYCHEAASRFVYILSRGQRFRSYIVPEDLVPLVQDVVDTHPGLAFLKEATEFHSRYVHTVIARIFYSVNRCWSGKITISELKKSDLLEIISLLEEEDDINQIMAFFSYEHFYVIYCKFWELDKDHDLLISQDDLAAHSDHALSTRIVERIFSGCVTRSDNKKSPDDEMKMSYTDFVWFLLSEEDKRSPTAIEYWFRCMDVDGDGALSMYELEYFYEEQQQRMEGIGIECLPFEDCLCQMLDMIKPQRRDCITLSDLKRCKMTHVFFDTFFNLEKYLDHEQRDPFASQRDEYSSDWDRFAAQEYELLITEEND